MLHSEAEGIARQVFPKMSQRGIDALLRFVLMSPRSVAAMGSNLRRCLANIRKQLRTGNRACPCGRKAWYPTGQPKWCPLCNHLMSP